MPRKFTLLLLAALSGGGWFYFQNPQLQQMNPFGQASGPGYGSSAPAGYYPAGQYPTNQPVAPSPAMAGGQAPVPPARGGPAIRIASFNIQTFGTEKVRDKPYIATELAGIIRNFQLVAIQEIRSQDNYLLDQFLRNYVNAGGKAYYDYVIGPRLGRSNSKEQYAFIYDTSAIEVNRQSIYTVNDPQDLLHREPLVGLFRAKGPAPYEAFTFVLAVIHTDPDEANKEVDTLADVYRAVRQVSGGEDDIIILGDFNQDDRHLGRLTQIPGVRPIVTGVFSNTRQNQLYDNIVVHQPSTTEFTGRWGVFDYQHARKLPLTIEQALQVSDHFPVWAEFSAYESAAPGRVATRGGADSTATAPAAR